jgi:hypothetical protein
LVEQFPPHSNRFGGHSPGLRLRVLNCLSEHFLNLAVKWTFGVGRETMRNHFSGYSGMNHDLDFRIMPTYLELIRRVLLIVSRRILHTMAR